MATIKLPNRTMMNQNVRPTQLQADDSIGKAYDAVGRAAQSLGKNLLKYNADQQKLTDDAWVLKAQRQATEHMSAKTIENQENMDEISGMMRVPNKDGTMSISETSFQEKQKSDRGDIYKILQKDATSDAAWATFQRRDAGALLSGISKDDMYVKNQGMDAYEGELHTNQDARTAGAYTHDPVSTGVSHLKQASDNIEATVGDMIGADEKFGAARYRKNMVRGTRGVAFGFLDKSLTDKRYGEAMMGAGLLIGQHKEETLGQIQSTVKDELGGQKLETFEEDGRLSIVSADGKMQWNEGTGHMEPYDGSASFEIPQNTMFDYLDGVGQGSIYKRLVTGLNSLTKNYSGVVNNMIEGMSSKLMGFGVGKPVDPSSEEFVNWKESAIAMNSKLTKSLPLVVENNIRKIGAIEELAVITTAIKMQDPAIAMKNLINMTDMLEKKYGDDPIYGRAWRDALVGKAMTQYKKMRKAQVDDSSNYIINNDETIAAAYKKYVDAMGNNDLSIEEKRAVSKEYHTLKDDAYKTLQIPKNKRKTHPNAYYKAKFEGITGLFNGLKDYTTAEMGRVSQSLTDLYTTVPPGEMPRVINEFAKDMNDPRVLIIGKVKNPTVQMELLMSLRAEKLNGSNFSNLSVDKQKKLKKAVIAKSSPTTALLQSVLESEGGGMGAELQKKHAGLIESHAAFIYTNEEVTPKEAVTRATNAVFGEHQVETYGGNYNAVKLAIPKDHIQQNGWDEDDIGGAVNLTQNPQWLRDNVDENRSFRFIDKEINGILRASDPQGRGVTPYRRDTIKQKILDKMYGTKLTDEDVKERAKFYKVSEDKIRKDYEDEIITTYKPPKITTRYFADSQSFAPVMIVKGKVIKFYPNIGVQTTSTSQDARESEDFLAINMENSKNSGYEQTGWLSNMWNSGSAPSPRVEKTAK